MMKKIIFLLSLVTIIGCSSSSTQEEDKTAILNILNFQEKAWNNHDLDEYMKGYWNNDSLKFYGASGLTYGWDKTLANYKKKYSSKDLTGTLKFKINDISKINDGAYFVMGEYYLTRNSGNANGVFMIVFKKINGEWKIIADTST